MDSTLWKNCRTKYAYPFIFYPSLADLIMWWMRAFDFQQIPLTPDPDQLWGSPTLLAHTDDNSFQRFQQLPILYMGSRAKATDVCCARGIFRQKNSGRSVHLMTHLHISEQSDLNWTLFILHVGDAQFESRLEHRPFWLRFFVFFLIFPRKFCI
jgi:hypothetical protein